MSSTKQPKWAVEVTIRTGLAVRELAQRYRDQLGSRIDGVTEQLSRDLDDLRAAVSGTTSSRADRKSSTAAQQQAAREGAVMVAACRRAIRYAHPDNQALRRSFGIGQPVQPRKVASVAGALQTVLDAAAKAATEVATAGITADDLAAARSTLDRLLDADVSQEARKISSKEATALRTAIHLRVEAGVGKVLAAAAVVFRGRPAVAAEFVAAVPGHVQRSRGSNARTAATASEAA